MAAAHKPRVAQSRVQQAKYERPGQWFGRVRREEIPESIIALRNWDGSEFQELNDNDESFQIHRVPSQNEALRRYDIFGNHHEYVASKWVAGGMDYCPCDV
jgi:hypothetical protein